MILVMRMHWEKIQTFFPLAAVLAGIALVFLLGNSVNIADLSKQDYDPEAVLCETVIQKTGMQSRVPCYPGYTSLEFNADIYRASQFWYVTLYLYCSILVITVFICWRLIAGSLKAYPPVYRWTIYGLILAVSIVFAGLSTCEEKTLDKPPGLTNYDGEPIKFTECRDGPFAPPLSDLLMPAVVALNLQALKIANWLNVSGAIAILIIVITACSLLIWSRTPVQESAEQRIDRVKIRLNEQMHRLNILLYIGALMLVARIVEMTAFYHLPAKFVPDNEIEVAASVVQTLIVLNGAIFSVLLAVLYLTTAFILRNRAQQLAEEEIGKTSTTSRQEWLTENNLSMNIAQKFISLVAILAPLFPGTVDLLVPAISFAG